MKATNPMWKRGTPDPSLTLRVSGKVGLPSPSRFDQLIHEGPSMNYALYHVNAFTSRPFAGNPAAVCPLDGPADPGWMQHVAAQMNLSETAFVHPEGDAYRLRWFTPLVEVDLCGHATLATSHVLWETGWLDPHQPARFQTRSGQLSAARDGDWITLDFPSRPPEPCPVPPELPAGLGIPVREAFRGGDKLLVEVESEQALRALQPDFAKLALVPVVGVIVTSQSHGGYDFASRFFAPAVGVPEDPVCGSAHCTLGPYWHGKLGKERLLAFQASARGGELRVAVAGQRVRLGGQARTVLRGMLLV